MIEYEDPSFKALRYAPNPKDFSYWIDLGTDKYGNVIRTYNPEEKRWIPINHDYNKDLWQHIQELVTALGFIWGRPDDDAVKLSDFSSNNYFKDGDNLTVIISNGDAAIKAEIVRLDKRIDDEIKRATTREDQLEAAINAEATTRAQADTLHDSHLSTLDTQCSNLLSRIQQIESRLQTLESIIV